MISAAPSVTGTPVSITIATTGARKIAIIWLNVHFAHVTCYHATCKKVGTQENGFCFHRVHMRVRARVYTRRPTNEGNEVSGNGKDSTVIEANGLATSSETLCRI